MPRVITEFHEIQCDGTTSNLRHPQCPSISTGVWAVDADTLDAAALAAGWTNPGGGKKWLCPQHPAEKPAARKATPKVEDTP